MEEEGFLIQGGVSAAAVAFLQEAVLRMIPYAVPALVLIILDLFYGIRAAKARVAAARAAKQIIDPVRLSTAVRRSVTKVFSYICWIILASTLAVSFHQDWLEWTVLGLVYANELASIVGNYLETKGIEFSLLGFYRWILKLLAGKAGEAMDDFEAGGIIKPKDGQKGRHAQRDPRTGRYVPRERPRR